jgi:hypothetical protein
MQDSAKGASPSKAANRVVHAVNQALAHPPDSHEPDDYEA